MPRLHPDLVWLGPPERPALFSPTTGRHLRVAADGVVALQAGDAAPERAPLWRRLADLGLTTEGPDPLALRPCRSRCVLLLPDRPALWYPLPTHPTPGGFAHAALPLDPEGVALWRAANGGRTLAEVADHAGVPRARAAAFFRRLTAPDVQAAQLRARPPRPRDPGLARLVALPRPGSPRPADQRGAHGETTLGAYHAAIDHPDRHFDDRETTVAHAFAVPHPALGGRPFGAALHAGLGSRGMLPSSGTVLEIGGGDGELGADFWAAAAAAGRPTGRALRLDASPALLALQAARQPHTIGTLGDATQLPYPDGGVDLVLCNEVMADLMATPWGRGERGGPASAVADRVARYGLTPLPPGALHNLGAWQLVEEVGRVLAPGGAAFLSEFGALDEVPTETTQLDHPEVSIHFGHLRQVAEGCGLEAEVVSLADLLGADLAARWLSRPSWDAARALAAAAGAHLPARAWTAATVPLPEPVEGLVDAPVSADGPGPVLTRFLALLIRRPG